VCLSPSLPALGTQADHCIGKFDRSWHIDRRILGFPGRKWKFDESRLAALDGLNYVPALHLPKKATVHGQGLAQFSPSKTCASPADFRRERSPTKQHVTSSHVRRRLRSSVRAETPPEIQELRNDALEWLPERLV
jgi:hypothetical protein